MTLMEVYKDTEKGGRSLRRLVVTQFPALIIFLWYQQETCLTTTIITFTTSTTTNNRSNNSALSKGYRKNKESLV